MGICTPYRYKFPLSARDPDIEVTKRLKEVGEIVGVDFLDHIILGDNSHISLKETHFF